MFRFESRIISISDSFPSYLRLVKRLVFFVFVLFFSSHFFGQEVKNITFLDRWFQDSLPSNSSQVRFSGCWGFTKNGKEYAVVGSTYGTHVFLITNENKFQPIGSVKGRYSSAQVVTREAKVFGNYLYATCDEGPSSLQIIDLQFLPDSIVLVNDLRNETFGRIHNLFVDEENALLYLCSVTPVLNNLELPMRPLCVFSLANPLEPQLLWTGPSDIPEVHDIFVRDNIAFLNCGFNGLRVYDFSNPTQPIYLNNLQFYSEQGYNHQGWLSPDGKTYVFGDETAGTRLKKVNVGANYELQVGQLFGRPNIPNPKTAHNLQITNDFAFVAYYNDGLRIYDLRTPVPQEIAAYDTYIDNELTNNFSMWGAWGIYALFPSERIIVSDRNNGLFLFHFDRNSFSVSSSNTFQLFPNPVSENEKITIRTVNDEITDFSVEIFDLTGKLLLQETITESSFWSGSFAVSGMYFLRLTYVNYLNEEISELKKFVVK